MTNHVVLNIQDHAKLKVNSQYSANLGDNISNTLTFPTEFAAVQREYPILFSKNPETGQFQSVVLFGLKSDENLFLNNGTWQANYIPSVITKGPFAIGFEQKNDTDDKYQQTPIVYIDLNNPKVNDTEGDSIFTQGENSAYLNKVSQALITIHDGNQVSQPMFDAFNEHDLIEPISLDIELNNGEKISIGGNYTINGEKLAKLSGNALEKLNNAGFLSLAFFVSSSLNNVQNLVDKKNQQLDLAK